MCDLPNQAVKQAISIVTIILLRTGTRAGGEASVQGSFKICYALLLTCGLNSEYKQKGKCLVFVFSLGLQRVF